MRRLLSKTPSSFAVVLIRNAVVRTSELTLGEEIFQGFDV